MQQFIREFIEDTVHRYKGKTAYRTPLIGFARADDPGFPRLKEVVAPSHLLPEELLPGARSVIAFFVPFTGELVDLHRRHPFVSREWAEAYIETNSLIDDICRVLSEALRSRGVRAAWQKPTHNFDPVTLASFWSHKHVAYLCGLGTFGVHRMLITEAGCAGRLGSLVIDADLPATPLASGEYCLERRGKNCAACVRLCPSGALRREGLDKQRCYRHLLDVDSRFHDLGLCDVCGKCATGLCALGVPGAKDESE